MSCGSLVSNSIERLSFDFGARLRYIKSHMIYLQLLSGNSILIRDHFVQHNYLCHKRLKNELTDHLYDRQHHALRKVFPLAHSFLSPLASIFLD